MYFLPLHPVLSKGVSHARLPSMWPGFESQGRLHLCRLGLLLVFSFALRGFSPGTSVLPSPLKPTLSNSNSIWNARTCFNEFLTTPRCSLVNKLHRKKWPQLLKRQRCLADKSLHPEEKYSLDAGDFSLLTRKISPIALYSGQRFIQWITIEQPLLGSYMLVPMLSLHCMALHFFQETKARSRPQVDYSPQASPTRVYSPDLFLSFIQVLSSASQDIDLRLIFFKSA